MIELTPNAEELVRGRDLRGEVWIWDREGERGKDAAVIGTFCERLDTNSLRPAFDIEPILLRVFYVRKIRLGIPNPMPAKVYLEPVADAPPNLPDLPGEQTARTLSPEELRDGIRRLKERAKGTLPDSTPSTNGRSH